MTEPLRVTFSTTNPRALALLFEALRAAEFVVDASPPRRSRPQPTERHPPTCDCLACKILKNPATLREALVRWRDACLCSCDECLALHELVRTLE